MISSADRGNVSARALSMDTCGSGSSELTAAAALTSLVSSVGHTMPPNVHVPTHQHHHHQEELPRKPAEDFDFPTQFTKSGRKKAVPFPVRLMKVLETPEYEHIISWLPSGSSFKVHNSKLFTKEVLPIHFKSAKFSSFTRKLHRWNFVRHYRGQEEGAFFHDQFLRGRMDLAARMSCHAVAGQESPKSAASSHPKMPHQHAPVKQHKDMSIPPPPPPPPPHQQPGMPHMSPYHMPDNVALPPNPAYGGQFYPPNHGFYESNTPQRQLARQMGHRMSMPQRQPSSNNNTAAPSPSSFSPDLNVAIEMEVSRRLEEIMSVSANLEMMKEQAKMTAMNRFQSYPQQQQQQQQPQMQMQMGQGGPGGQQGGGGPPSKGMLPVPNAMPTPPPPPPGQQHSAVGAKTA